MHALSDSELAASGMAFTILKPHFFTQNLLMSAQTVIDQGTIYFGLGEAKLPMIDTRDISDVVAAILANPAPYAGKTLTLTGPTAISIHQVAAAIGEAIGKPVKYQPVPVLAMVETMAKYGVDDFGQTAMRDYFTAYSAGWQDTVTTTVKDVLGREPRGSTRSPATTRRRSRENSHQRATVDVARCWHGPPQQHRRAGRASCSRAYPAIVGRDAG
ncbi:MAG: NmrA family NAD(P)-binding protein [Kofleriaceae bacterium]